MRRRRNATPASFAILAVVAGLAVVVPAQADPVLLGVRTGLNLEVGVESGNGRSVSASVLGRVTSSKKPCVRNRKVRFYFERNGSLQLRDVGRSSRNGEVGLTGTGRLPDRYIVKVALKLVHPNHNGYACDPKKAGFKPHGGAPG